MSTKEQLVVDSDGSQHRPDLFDSLRRLSGSISETYAQTIRVLVVDNDEQSLQILKTQLLKFSYLVDVVTSSSAALALLQQCYGTLRVHHAVLVNVHMPVMPGHELVIRIREDPNLCDLPVIMMSSASETGEVYRCLQSGADDYLLKPILSSTLQNMWQYVWRKRREKELELQLLSEREARQQLQSAVDKLKHEVIAAVETPLQMITQSLQKMLQEQSMSKEARTLLLNILTSLRSSNMYQPAIEKILQDPSVDPATRTWLEQEVVREARRPSLSPVTTTRRQSQDSRSRKISSQMRLPDSFVDKLSLMHAASLKVPTPLIEDPLEALLVALNLNNSPEEIEAELVTLRSREFNVWLLSEDQLPRLVALIFHDLNLFEDCNIQPATFKSFIKAVQINYKSTNPYHNFRHAFDVFQSVYMYLYQTMCISHLGSIEMLALLVAAICHDLSHPGTNNTFQIVTGSQIAILYNDTSVLENMHSARTFQLLNENNGANNIFAGLIPDEKREVRAILIKCILATDLARHLELVARLNQVADGFTWEDPVHRKMSMEMLIKCADVGNPTRPLPIARKWSDLVQQESFMQGDLERELKIPISPFMDRFNPQQPRMAISFTDYMVMPLFKGVSKIFPEIAEMIPALEANRAYWEGVVQDAAKEPA